VRVNKACIGVEVLALCLDQVSFKAPVQGLDMRLNVLHHRGPVGLFGGIDVPALSSHITATFCKDARVVHHFLGDASNVDAGASNAPF